MTKHCAYHEAPAAEEPRLFERHCGRVLMRPPTVPIILVRVAAPPRRLRFRTALELAFLVRARLLPRTHPLIRPEPFSTIPAWPLLQPRAHPHQARRPSTSSPPPPLAYCSEECVRREAVIGSHTWERRDCRPSGPRTHGNNRRSGQRGIRDRTFDISDLPHTPL